MTTRMSRPDPHRERPLSARLADLPRRFQSAGPRGASGSVHLAVNGPEPGNWLITLAGDRCRVLAGSVPDPEARVYTDSEIALAVLDGAVTLEEAVRARLVDYDGDPGILRRLAAGLGLESE